MVGSPLHDSIARSRAGDQVVHGVDGHIASQVLRLAGHRRPYTSRNVRSVSGVVITFDADFHKPVFLKGIIEST